MLAIVVESRLDLLLVLRDFIYELITTKLSMELELDFSELSHTYHWLANSI